MAPSSNPRNGYASIPTRHSASFKPGMEFAPQQHGVINRKPTPYDDIRSSRMLQREVKSPYETAVAGDKARFADSRRIMMEEARAAANALAANAANLYAINALMAAQKKKSSSVVEVNEKMRDNKAANKQSDEVKATEPEPSDTKTVKESSDLKTARIGGNSEDWEIVEEPETTELTSVVVSRMYGIHEIAVLEGGLE